MVYVRPDIEAGTIQEGADVPPPPLPPHEADETDEEPDVEDIEVDCQVTSHHNFFREDLEKFPKICMGGNPKIRLGKLYSIQSPRSIISKCLNFKRDYLKQTGVTRE